jgi:hypothetical protein
MAPPPAPGTFLDQKKSLLRSSLLQDVSRIAQNRARLHGFSMGVVGLDPADL